MAVQRSGTEDLVSALLPGLSRSLSEDFNVFRVMHHGTHEKQLSNVFAWLLNPAGTHELGDVFQRIFLDKVNADLPAEEQLPPSGYTVAQEVNTQGDGADAGQDIADMLLTRADAALAVENYGVSDGHGHDYHRYLSHARGAGRRAAVVLLCLRHIPERQQDGWNQAVVLTYGGLLRELNAHVAADRSWRRRHPEQHFFLQQMHRHFVEGPSAVNLDDQLAFIRTMCETGESARYGHRPQARAAEEFADLVAEHARRQFEDSRKVLAQVKARLRSYARAVLTDQVNEKLDEGRVVDSSARLVGQWEWCVTLKIDDRPFVHLEFGPTAVVEVDRALSAPDDPDYSTVFVTRQGPSGGIDLALPTTVTLHEVLDGLDPEDLRLRDTVLDAIAAPRAEAV